MKLTDLSIPERYDRVAAQVSMRRVDMAEVVEVQQRQGQGLAAAQCAHGLALEQFIEAVTASGVVNHEALLQVLTQGSAGPLAELLAAR